MLRWARLLIQVMGIEALDCPYGQWSFLGNGSSGPGHACDDRVARGADRDVLTGAVRDRFAGRRPAHVPRGMQR